MTILIIAMTVWQYNQNKTVTYTPTGEVYGKISKWEESKIKGVLLKGNLARLVLSPSSFGFRVFHLLSGHWAWKTGYEAGLKSWKIARCKAFANSRSMPGKGDLAARVALYSLYYFGKSSFQLLTQPIQIALSFIVTLGALFNGQYARRLQGKIDYFWKVDFEINKCWAVANQNIPVLLLITPMPCMLSNLDVDKINFHRKWFDYHPGTVRSLALSLQSQLNDYKEIFSDKDFKKMLEAVTSLRRNIKKISEKDQDETDNYGNLNNDNPKAVTMRKTLSTAQEKLSGYIQNSKDSRVLLEAFASIKEELEK